MSVKKSDMIRDTRAFTARFGGFDRDDKEENVTDSDSSGTDYVWRKNLLASNTDVH